MENGNKQSAEEITNNDKDQNVADILKDVGKDIVDDIVIFVGYLKIPSMASPIEMSPIVTVPKNIAKGIIRIVKKYKR